MISLAGTFSGRSLPIWQGKVVSEESLVADLREIATRIDGQLYTVLGEATDDGRWQLRLWWKPFVPMIWYGGILIALGGLLALFGRLVSDLKRLIVRDKIAYRRMRQGR